MSKKARLRQFLLRSGQFKDSHEIDSLLNQGRITVAGKVVTSPAFEFRPTTKEVKVNGKKVSARLEDLYFIFNKPAGIVCQKNDGQGRTDVWRYLHNQKKLPDRQINSLVSVGRLDIDTEGLLILTTDGDLVNRVTQPESKVEKEYHAVVKGYVSNEAVQKLTQGLAITIKLEGKEQKHQTLPAKVKILSRDEWKSELIITICEGKKRQVREMLREVGNEVIMLKRNRIGRIELGNLAVGEIKRIEKEKLFSLLF